MEKNLPVIDEEVYESGLTVKQERFCFYVSQGMSAAESYLKAKYKVKTDAAARANASRLLTNANVKAFIRHLRQQAINKSIADLTEVKQGLTEIFRAKITDFIETDAKGIARVKISPDTLNSRAIQEVVTETIQMGDSPIKTQISKIKLRDPVAAGLGLSKISGWHSDAGANVYNDNRQININDSAREKLFSKLASIASKVPARTALEESNRGGS